MTAVDSTGSERGMGSTTVRTTSGQDNNASGGHASVFRYVALGTVAPTAGETWALPLASCALPALSPGGCQRPLRAGIVLHDRRRASLPPPLPLRCPCPPLKLPAAYGCWERFSTAARFRRWSCPHNGAAGETTGLKRRRPSGAVYRAGGCDEEERGKAGGGRTTPAVDQNGNCSERRWLSDTEGSRYTTGPRSGARTSATLCRALSLQETASTLGHGTIPPQVLLPVALPCTRVLCMCKEL